MLALRTVTCRIASENLCGSTTQLVFLFAVSTQHFVLEQLQKHLALAEQKVWKRALEIATAQLAPPVYLSRIVHFSASF